MADGKLAFDDLSRQRRAAARISKSQWASYDNNRRTDTKCRTRGTEAAASASDTEYLAATIGCERAADASCAESGNRVPARSGTGFEVVGIDAISRC